LLTLPANLKSNITPFGGNIKADAMKLNKRKIAPAIATAAPGPVLQAFSDCLQESSLKKINVIPSVKNATPSNVLQIFQAIGGILMQDMRIIVTHAMPLEMGASMDIACAALSERLSNKKIFAA